MPEKIMLVFFLAQAGDLLPILLIINGFYDVLY